MFSGITQGSFPFTVVEWSPELLTFNVDLNDELVAGLKVGASVAVDGVCQTVVAIDGCTVTFQAMEETLRLTTLAQHETGDRVHIERSLRFGDEVGGHICSGHVDGMGVITNKVLSNEQCHLRIRVPLEWMRMIVPKGFIAVDGCSLTVCEPDNEGHFSVYLIPETLRMTQFGAREVGDSVNIELDATTKSVARLVEFMLANR